MSTIKTVLLVDDDRDVSASVASVLKDLDYNVVAIDNGLKAMEWLAHNEPPDLIITDFKMMGRGDLVAKAASRVKIPIVMISAMGIEAQEACEKSNVNIPVFSKPLDYEQLAKIVERFIGQSVPPMRFAA